MSEPDSLFSPAFQAVYAGKRAAFPSPADWRDQPIYFVMVDRFNNPAAPPIHAPFDDPSFFGYQGGSFAGLQAKLGYIKRLGAGALWLSPVLKNLPFSAGSYHGYGIHDFLHAEPRFATDPAQADDELRALVDAAHAAGLFVIFDIVLNHTGDVFAYRCAPDDPACTDSQGSQAAFKAAAQPVLWRDGTGTARADWPLVEAIPAPPSDALVWPKELQQTGFFRRQGGMPAPDDDTIGDFASLKQMTTATPDLQNALIRAYQYVIARFDVDGFRIDTLRYLKGDLAQTFGNAIREYALSIGKKNFFTFGEVWTGDSEAAIARFIGRNTAEGGDLVGVDAALDYPLFNTLKAVVKGFAPPRDAMALYQRRKAVERSILSSHGDATRYFVTFLDNHDVKERLRHAAPATQPMLDHEVTLGLACLAGLPGIPCLYYGTEQGLHGQGTDAAVREALWGGPGFDETSPFFVAIAAIHAVRAAEPAFRYGRFYFRQLSGDGVGFGFSSFTPGVLAFSRILNDREVLVVANADKTLGQTLHVVVDALLSPVGRALAVLFSNRGAGPAPGAVEAIAKAQIEQVDGSTSAGRLHATLVTLQPGEVQMLG